jgi:hypothetical protein
MRMWVLIFPLRRITDCWRVAGGVEHLSLAPLSMVDYHRGGKARLFTFIIVLNGSRHGDAFALFF